MREWLKDAQNIRGIAQNADLSAQKASTKKIFGSDLPLSAKKITGRPAIQWAAIAAARNFDDKTSLCTRMERVKGVGPSFQPWEGCIIAVIRHPPSVRSSEPTAWQSPQIGSRKRPSSRLGGTSAGKARQIQTQGGFGRLVTFGMRSMPINRNKQLNATFFFRYCKHRATPPWTAEFVMSASPPKNYLIFEIFSHRSCQKPPLSTASWPAASAGLSCKTAITSSPGFL